MLNPRRGGDTYRTQLVGMSENEAARLVGINHVALPVDDAEAAIEFYRENKASASELDPEGEADT